MDVLWKKLTPVGICVLVFALALAGYSQEEREPLKKSAARKLIKSFLSKSKKRSEQAKLAMLALHPDDRPLLIESFKKGILEPDKLKKKNKKGPFEVSIKAPGMKGGYVSAVITLPKGYKKKAFPLIIRSHGSGMGGDSLMQIWDEVGPIKEKFISVTPTMPFGEIGGKVDLSGPEFIPTYDAIYRYMLKHFRVDTDRVYLSGYFMGSGLSSLLAQLWPQRFVAIHCSGLLFFANRMHKKASILAAHQVPGFFIIGEKDAEYRIDSHRITERHLQSVEGYRGKFNYIPGVGENQPFFENMDSQAYSFLLRHERVPTARSFTGYLSCASHWDGFEFRNQYHWVKAIEIRDQGVLKVETTGQSIAIDAPHLKKAEVFLNDEIVDFEKPVKIVLNGKKVFEGKVERSVEFLLEQIDQERDLKRLYWNKITVGA